MYAIVCTPSFVCVPPPLCVLQMKLKATRFVKDVFGITLKQRAKGRVVAGFKTRQVVEARKEYRLLEVRPPAAVTLCPRCVSGPGLVAQLATAGSMVCWDVVGVASVGQ